MSIKQDIREEREERQRQEVNKCLSKIGLQMNDQGKLQVKPKDDDRGFILRED